MNHLDLERLKARAFHDVEADETPLKITYTGATFMLLSDQYRLSVLNDFLYLTDVNIPSSAGCTCHGKGVESLDDLIMILQEARRLMTERAK